MSVFQESFYSTIVFIGLLIGVPVIVFIRDIFKKERSRHGRRNTKVDRSSRKD